MANESPRIVESYYDDTDDIEDRVAQGLHRQLVGGLWEELGALQHQFLVSRGLRPQDRLLDLGCGSLRGGVHYVRYLDPGHYYGLDLSQALLDAGYDKELAAAGLQERCPRTNLLADPDFGVDQFGVQFDKAIALSVFTHMSLNRVRKALEKVAKVMKPGATFYATVFACPENQPAGESISHGEITTHGDRDPYHYKPSDLVHAARGLPFAVEWIGDWGHPREQNMVAFHRLDDPSRSRELTADAAAALGPGDDHYRAYVGPPGRFDFMSSTQFALLFQAGLTETDRVLDMGCGSLRLGRLLIPFLRPGGYAGIDPNRWLIEDGIDRELGRDTVMLKKPQFQHNSDFDAAGFAQPFDFVIAQSIATHCGPSMMSALFAGSAQALKRDGLFLFSYIREDHADGLPDEGWHYPGCVGYREAYVKEQLHQAGLYARSIDWHHPAASWMAASPSRERLPNPDDARNLAGWVMPRRG